MSVGGRVAVSKAPEVADIFRKYGPAYREANKLPLQQLKAMRAIEACRTPELGGFWEVCDNCGVTRKVFRSCRNRNCPKCGWMAKEKWLQKRKEDLLPVPYFHVVLTIPDLLNRIALQNQQVIYDILFKAGSETLLELGRDPKHLGGDIGFMAILHTWGFCMVEHPHLHCVVPGGGLSEDEVEWLSPKKSKKKKKFFVHVNIISDLFRGKFIDYLSKAYQKGELTFAGQIAYLRDPQNFRHLKNQLYDKKWVTFCKRPFGGPQEVLEYLSRYTHRVAISNHRIIKVEHGRVYLKWKNNRNGCKLEEHSLEVFEFIRRFLLHVLPNNFYKIRYYGILANRHRRTKIAICQEILSVVPSEKSEQAHERSFEEWFLEFTGIEPGICAVCKTGRMIRVEELPPRQHAPP